jgi:hypothetical protein
MPIELDPLNPTAVGRYGGTPANRWGSENIQKWSQLDPTLNSTDTARVQLSLDYADAEIDGFFAGGRNTVPFTGYVAADNAAVILRNWEETLAGIWLAHARFASVGESLPDELQRAQDETMTEMAQYRSGVRSLSGASLRTEAKSLIPTTV